MTASRPALSARERWDRRFADLDQAPIPTFNPLLEQIADWPSGCAIDVAGGRGQNATWLAQRGLETTLVDVSRVGLALARRHAESCRVELTTIQHDLETDGLFDSWDVIFCTNFLDRSLYRSFSAHLNPGGLLIVEHPTHSNLKKNPRPSARFLLEDGELKTLFDNALEVELSNEAWRSDGRHMARFVGRRPGPA